MPSSSYFSGGSCWRIFIYPSRALTSEKITTRLVSGFEKPRQL
jgi:hypothetical protein